VLGDCEKRTTDTISLETGHLSVAGGHRPFTGRGVASTLHSAVICRAVLSRGFAPLANNERLWIWDQMARTEDKVAVATDDIGFVGGICPAMRTLENVVTEIAPTNIPVLFVGESGTGKAMFAQRVHRLSAQSHQPLVNITCAAMDPAQLSSELRLMSGSGNENSGTVSGTVVFDEISELDAACQRNLLYALPDGDGSSRRGCLEARIISITSRNLDEEMRVGRFRTELYYRVNGVCLRLPPLRDRREDIPILVEFFLSKHAVQLGRRRPSLSARTLRMLLEHSWPGNIRELENVVKKIVALGDEQLGIAELASATMPLPVKTPEAPAYSLKAAARAASRVAEREMILKALSHTRWNRKRAAQELQISYKSLLYKLKQIGVQDSEAD
jgi:two-component system, NtrC family, response regulator AtoC